MRLINVRVFVFVCVFMHTACVDNLVQRMYCYLLSPNVPEVPEQTMTKTSHDIFSQPNPTTSPDSIILEVIGDTQPEG